MDAARGLDAELLRRVSALEREGAALRAQCAGMQAQLGVALTRNAELETELAAAQARLHELERELARRGKKKKPGGGGRDKQPGQDGRKKGKRKHPGTTRPPADPERPEVIASTVDVVLEQCPDCGGPVTQTGRFDERIVEDIPEPKIEVTTYRRHECQCVKCGLRAKGRADLDVPGSRIGPRARLLAAYARVGLGVSLGKLQNLCREFWRLGVSRSGWLGLQQWTAAAFDPVAAKLLEMLRASPVLHADETSWPHAGKYRWCWVLCNPKLAVFLIEERRNRATFERLLAGSVPGTLVTDFYAVYHGMGKKQQRCLAHLMVTLKELRERLSPRHVALNIKPLIELLGELFQLARERKTLAPETFAERAAALRTRFADVQEWHSAQPDCERILDRLRRHRDELLTFLDDPAVPPDNNLAERAARGVANDRGMGRGSRSEPGSKGYGVLKSVLTTCRLNGLNFFDYGLSALRAALARLALPLPLAQPP